MESANFKKNKCINRIFPNLNITLFFLKKCPENSHKIFSVAVILLLTETSQAQQRDKYHTLV